MSRSPLAITSQVGSRFYYHLTLEGYRMWQQDPDATPPTKRFFLSKADAFHQHLYAKAQFLAHLTVKGDEYLLGHWRDEFEGDLRITADHDRADSQRVRADGRDYQRAHTRHHHRPARAQRVRCRSRGGRDNDPVGAVLPDLVSVHQYPHVNDPRNPSLVHHDVVQSKLPYSLLAPVK